MQHAIKPRLEPGISIGREVQDFDAKGEQKGKKPDAQIYDYRAASKRPPMLDKVKWLWSASKISNGDTNRSCNMIDLICVSIGATQRHMESLLRKTV
jgi:hypothetical protein